MWTDGDATSSIAARKVVNSVSAVSLTRGAGSTSNLRKHALSCWGEDSVAAVTGSANIKDARESVKSIKESGSITAAFEKKGKGKITYSHRQHTKTETK
jgi:hypothetical protein